MPRGAGGYVRVRATLGTGEDRVFGAWSHPVRGDAPAPPAVPTGLQVSATGPGFIVWTWSPVEGAAGYQVQFRADEGFTEEDEVVERTVEETSYRRESLPAAGSGLPAGAGDAGDGREPPVWRTGRYPSEAVRPFRGSHGNWCARAVVCCLSGGQEGRTYVALR